MKATVKEIAEVLGGTIVGNPEAVITCFARIEHGKPEAISFFANPKYEKYVYSSKSSAIIVNKTFVPAQEVAVTMIQVDDAYVAVAALLDWFTAKNREHKSYRGLRSRVRLSAKIGKKVYIGDFTYVGKKAVVGSYTKIYEQVFVGDNVRIGENCIIYPGVKIYPGTIIGNNVILQAGCIIGSDGFGFAPQADGSYKKIEHTGNVIIEDDVEIGANTCIDKSQMESTIIRKGVKLDNLIQIAHNVELGKNTVMAAMCGVAGSAKIGENCVFGGQCGVAGHLTVADRSSFGAQTGVFSKIEEPGKKWMGSPVLPYINYMRSYALFKAAGAPKEKK